MFNVFQQAFEWRNITYLFYPFFWGRTSNWVKTLIEFEDPDPAFAFFLRAGAARVIVPVREGFEDAVLHYAATKRLLDSDEEITMIDDDLYLDAIEEVKESLGAPDDAIPDPEGPWEVIVPTSLVILQSLDEISFRDPLTGSDMSIEFNTSIAEDTNEE